MEISSRIRRQLRKSERSTALGNDAVVAEEQARLAAQRAKADRRAAHEARVRQQAEQRELARRDACRLPGLKISARDPDELAFLLDVVLLKGSR